MYLVSDRRVPNAGYSLIDLVIVIMLVGITMAAAIPGLQGVASAVRLGQGAREVERELQAARLSAVSSNRPLRVRFDCPVAGSYRLVELLGTRSAPLADDSVADRCTTTAYPYPPADRNPLTRPNHDGPPRLLPADVSFGDGPTLEFWPDGSVHQQVAGENPWLPLTTEGGMSRALLKLGGGSGEILRDVHL